MLNIVYAIISALLGLGILIVIHELGHFLVAKKAGVGVLTFSIGFGPKIWSRKYGETEYAISAFPLGGYVKMLGEDPETEVSEAERHRSFSHQSLLKRAAIVGAGPLFNLLLTVGLLALIFMLHGLPVLTTRVAGVDPESPAGRAGLRRGDEIVAIDGGAIATWEDLAAKVRRSEGKTIVLRVRRDTQEFEASMQARRREMKTLFGETVETWVIGVASEPTLKRSDPLTAAGQAFYETGRYSALILVSLYKMLRGEIPADVGGPILIAQMAGQQARRGLADFFFFVAVLSVNLGVLNLLPIPVLDGGHLLFFAFEWLRGKPVAIKYQEKAQQIGIVLLVLIMLFAFYKDIVRFFAG
jgi:regulator of sigma E protease